MKSLQGIRDLKSVRKEILILMGAFVSRAEDLDIVLYRLTPPLLDAILDDYNASVAYAREAEVLRILDILVTKLEVRGLALSSEPTFLSTAHAPDLSYTIYRAYFRNDLRSNAGADNRGLY